MADVRSAQDFVRALKAPNDPPTPGGLLKIHLATHVWNDETFSLPSKAEVIVEWILTRFLKEKGNTGLASCVLDVEYWSLLSAIITPNDASQKNRDPRPIRLWLGSLLQRTPFSPIISAFLSGFRQSRPTSELANIVATCTTVVWPLASVRIGVEVLQEVLGAFMSYLEDEDISEGILKLGTFIASSYRNSLSTSPNKKKLFATFLQSHFKNWLYVFRLQRPLSQPTQKLLEDCGTETIFNLDILRQTQDAPQENALFSQLKRLTSQNRSLVLSSLSPLFSHFARAVKTHQGALFGQGSKHSPVTMVERFRTMCMNFFISSQELLEGKEGFAWSSQADLLRVVRHDNLFIESQTAAKAVLTSIVEVAIQTLVPGTSEHKAPAILLSLSELVQTDYDLVLPSIPRIISRLLHLQQGSKEATTFLQHSLDYHTKTRTLDDLVEKMLSAFSHPLDGSNLYSTYQLVMSGSPVQTQHLQRLGSAIHTLLTPGQCIPVAHLILSKIKEFWQLFHIAYKAGDGEAQPKLAQNLAIRFAVLARMGSVVLSSLPLHLLQSSEAEGLRQEIIDFRVETLHKSISSSLKSSKKRDRWPAEIVIAASLRLVYTINVAPPLGLPSDSDAEVYSKIEKALSRSDALPELKLEMVRLLLLRLSAEYSQESFDGVMEQSLLVLETCGLDPVISWSGMAHTLTSTPDGEKRLSLALLHMLLDRWLSFIEYHSNSEHLTRVMKVLLSIDPQLSSLSENQLSPSSFLLQTLHSARFWELPKIQDCVLHIFDEQTSPLSSASTRKANIRDLIQQAAPFRVLLLVPTEFFGQTELKNLVERAVSADVAISSSDVCEETALSTLTQLRTFVQRVHDQSPAFTQPPDHITHYLLHLQQPKASAISGDSKLRQATLNLISSYFSQLLKRNKNGTADTWLKAVLPVDECIPDQLSSIQGKSFMLLVDILIRGHSRDSLPENVIETLQSIQDDAMTATLPHLKAIRSSSTFDQDVTQWEGVVSLWHTLVSLEKWLDSPHQNVLTPIGTDLVAMLTPLWKSAPSGMGGLSYQVFSVLVCEVDLYPSDKRLHQQEAIIATYVTMASVFGAEVQEKLDLVLGQFIRGLSPVDFAYILDLLSEPLSSPEQLKVEAVTCLVHLGSIAVKHHPSHTFVHVQKFGQKFLGAFSERRIYTRGDIRTRLAALELVAQHCSDNQAALRSTELSAIWSFVSAMVTPSTTHDAETEPMVFHKVVYILNALIRLRRDLVLTTLPHLAMVLRQVMLTMRHTQPNLGAKQMGAVMNTLPSWIAPSQPLGVAEAKALSRALEGLLAKTTIRTYSSNTVSESQKAESLSKPFSKHAAYVVKAYVEAMNDPLCVVPVEIRKELFPGLFALCEMVSEHSRDSLMVSGLDSAGKVTMKALWKEYEKQRYVGKG